MGVPIKGRRLCGDGTDLHLVQSDSYINRHDKIAYYTQCSRT